MRAIPQNIFLPKHHERKNYMYVKLLENVAIFSFSPRKNICMVPSFLINPDMDRHYNGRYRLKINPDKLLNRKNMLLAIPPYTAKPHFRHRRYSAASGPDFRPRHFRPRRLDTPPLLATSGIDTTGNPKWIWSRCTNLHSPLHLTKQKRSHFHSDSLTSNTYFYTLKTFSLPR